MDHNVMPELTAQIPTFQNEATRTHTITATRGVMQRIADGERNAVDDCSIKYGPLIWAWATKLTDSTSDAEAATRDILATISDSAKAFDSTQCNEVTFIKQICIRRLMGGRAV